MSRWTEKQYAEYLQRHGVPSPMRNAAVVSEQPFSPPPAKTIICKDCGTSAPRRGPVQSYCEKCSTARDMTRKRLHAKNSYPAKRSAITARGIEISRENSRSILDEWPVPNLLWAVRVAIPFQWSGSKNAIFALRQQGHVALRRESSQYRDAITHAISAALGGRRVAHNKVWVEILVQKPNQRGDAQNFVDLICDAVKTAVGVDDRWFSLKRVDWQISKHDPKIFISVGQETTEDVQACSSCGRILPLDLFHKSKLAFMGVSRNCRECASARVKRPA